MDTLLQELRHAVRRLSHAPGFVTVVILTLALGIGANAAIFTVVDAVMLRPLPYPQPSRLVTINHYYPTLGPLEAPVSAPGFRDYRDKTQSFQNVAVETGGAVNLTGVGDPERIPASRVSGDWFKVLGIQPALGRTLTPDDDQPGQRQTVLSHGLWKRLFGGERGALGKTLQLDGETYTVVGVMPPTFADIFSRDSQLWVPLSLKPEDFVPQRYTTEFLPLVARLKEGVSAAQAADEMARFGQRMQKELPDNIPASWMLKVTAMEERVGRGIRPVLLMLLGAVAFVLCIACANVANLVLVRGAVRSREVAIRAALGGDRWALARPLLVESVLLALLGGACGLLLASFGVDALLALAKDRLPRADEIQVNSSVALFALGLSLLSALLFGVVPALQSSRANLHEALAEGGRTGSSTHSDRLRRTLVIAEVALALTLLVGAGLLMRSFARVVGVDPGFQTGGVLTFAVNIPGARYPTAEVQKRFFEDAVERVKAIPGVQEAGATSVLPFSGNWSTSSFTIEGHTTPPGEARPWGDVRIVTPGFLEALKVPVLKGRLFTAADREKTPDVVIIDDEMVRRFFKGRDPLGARLTFDGTPNEKTKWFTVVGVVGHTMHEGLDAKPRVQYYLPVAQQTFFGRQGAGMNFAVRVGRDPMAIVGDARAAIRSLDPLQPIARVRPLEEMVHESMGQRRLALLLLGVFAGLALVLASLGIYGVISHNVAQRTRELGIRMALGAARQDVLRLVVKQGVTLTGIGIAIGALGSLALTRLIQGQLFGVQPTDPTTFALTSALLAAIAFLAALLPAMRATRVDPAVALRAE